MTVPRPAMVKTRSIKRRGLPISLGGSILPSIPEISFFVREKKPTCSISLTAGKWKWKSFPLPVGINVIHNGGVVCLGIALAAQARFIRVCIYTGARVWDTGEFDHGCAAELTRKRKELHAEHIHFFCDVDKKHSVGFPGIDLATHITWTEFYGADALIVSGKMTGDAPVLDEVREARNLATKPILIGSGATEENVGAFLQFADGVIVGSSLKKDNVMENPVDVQRVRHFMDAVKTARETAAARR